MGCFKQPVYGPATGAIDLREADGILLGEAAGDKAGFSLSTAGDFNGDGLLDVLIGATGLVNEAGTVVGGAYLVTGPVWGTHSLSSASYRWLGEADGDAAGWSTTFLEDTDGDGYDDVLVGAVGNDRGGTAAGIVYLLRGGGAAAPRTQRNSGWVER